MWPFSALRRRQTDLRKVEHSGIGGQHYGGSENARWATGYLGGMLHPGSDYNWAQEVRDPGANAVVHACLRWIIDNITEPEPVVYRKTRGAGEPKEDSDHPVLDLLEEPNGEYDGDALLAAMACDYFLVSDTYLLKDRDNLGRVKALWWKPYWEVHPCWPSDGSQFISGYLHKPGGRGAGTRYEKEDVIHIRWGLDPGTGGRVGRHRTWPILRELAGLNEMSTYQAVLPKNLGIVPYVFTPKDVTNAESMPQALQGLRDWWQALTTRDGRGKPVIPSIPMEIHKLGLSPEEMALDKLPRLPTLLVCACFGIHPQVLSLSTDPKGLDNGGQAAEARKATYHDCLIPACKRIGKGLTRSLLSEFEKGPIRSRRMWIGYSFRNVDALSEDKSLAHQRTREDYKAGVIDRFEARTETGRQARPEDKDVWSVGSQPEPEPEEEEETAGAVEPDENEEDDA